MFFSSHILDEPAEHRLENRGGGNNGSTSEDESHERDVIRWGGQARFAPGKLGFTMTASPRNSSQVSPNTQ